MCSVQKSFSQNQNDGSFLKQDEDSNPHQQILSEINHQSPEVHGFGSSSQNHTVSHF